MIFALRLDAKILVVNFLQNPGQKTQIFLENFNVPDIPCQNPNDIRVTSKFMDRTSYLEAYSGGNPLWIRFLFRAKPVCQSTRIQKITSQIPTPSFAPSKTIPKQTNKQLPPQTIHRTMCERPP